MDLTFLFFLPMIIGDFRKKKREQTMDILLRILLIAGIAAAVLLVLLLVIARVTYKIACYNANTEPDDPHRVPKGEKYDRYRDEMRRIIDDTLSIPYEPVSILSRDGLKLFGKLYRTEGSDSVSLLMHGWHGIAERDFAAGVQIHLAHGDNVLLIDERAHGRSEGHVIAYGVKERYDCLDWISYILENFGPDVRILLHGVSMGAATVMMAAGLQLPENVKGIIADSGYTSPKEIICSVIKDKGYPPKQVYPLIRLGARLFGHFDPSSASANMAMSACTLPALFIHGTGDDFVPFAMGEANYNAAKGPKLFVRAEGAPHVMGYLYDKEQYLEKMNEFYRIALGK